MASLGALSSARSGLIAQGAALGVIGNNIANVSTIGFKGARADFTNLLSAFSIGGGGEIGLGTRVGLVSADFNQGSIENTGRVTDLAIEGNGFFIARSPEGLVYTRAGNFNVDANGRLVTFQNDPIQGFKLNAAGQPAGAAVDIALTGANSQPQATTSITLKANLDAGASVIAGGFVSTDFDTAAASANFGSSIRVFDSLGGEHVLSVYYTKTGTNTWDVNVAVDAGETGGTAGALALVTNASLTFNTDGSLLSTTPDPITSAPVTFTGAAPQTLTFDLGTPNPTAVAGEGIDGISQFNAPSAVTAQFEDGFGAGQLVGLQFSPLGVVTGVFDNGQTRPLFQLALANFPAPDGLSSLGQSYLRETSQSGSPAVGVPKAGGLGTIVPGSVEQSNVDLATQFIELIGTQKNFQANARVITVGDTLLNDLINIVR